MEGFTSQTANAEQALPKTLYAYRFSTLWRPVLRRFVPESTVKFVKHTSTIPQGSTVLIWGRKTLDITRADLKLVRVEDGFLRSVGLGAEFVPPVSWIFDQSGIYFDATVPSDLENLLQQTRFSPDLVNRAVKLRQQVVSLKLTKYNVGLNSVWCRPRENIRVILIPGQVESDASIAFGSSEVKTNLDMVRLVRQEAPEAYIIYKPHPDVVAGVREEGQDEENANRYCDEIITDISMAELLPQVDEIHTITSLTGFEALLRGKKVVCYGQPFYSGWGLTTDRYPLARRTRLLSLDELVAAVLILYPRYVSRVTHKPCEPEQIILELTNWRQNARPDKLLTLKKWLRSCLTRLKDLSKPS
ncbi:hypothetical protein RLON56S_01142 [Alishewanella longhuensis]